MHHGPSKQGPADGQYLSGPASAQDFASPVQIPDHQLIRCIDRGSYGTVWMARNVMGALRAVKFVFRSSFRDQRPYERELDGIRRFEPISRSHDGFVDVLHIGTNDSEGCFYYIMELADDDTSGQTIDPERYVPKTLSRELRRCTKLALSECISLGLALSEALTALHQHGLVHRDIKPSNIIFVGGSPKLADIGLVADACGAPSFVGTEGYIPPEGPGTVQADIYSLGKLLYEASTGKDRHDFPELPPEWDQSPEHGGFLELNEIVLQACSNDLRQRYATASELHQDLMLVAHGKSVKRLKLLERRFAQAKRIGAVVSAAALVVAAVSYHFYREWRHDVEFKQQQVGAGVAYGNEAMQRGDLLAALPHYIKAFQLDSATAANQATHRLRLGSVLAQCPKVTHLGFGDKRLQHGEFSPDGKQLLLTEFYGRVVLFDLHTGQRLSNTYEGGGGCIRASFSPQGDLVAVANQDGTVVLCEATTLKPLRTLTHPDRTFSASFSLDGRWLVTSCRDSSASIWNVETGALVNRLTGHTAPVRYASFSRDGKKVVTASQDQTALVWDVSTGRPLTAPMAHPRWVNHASFSPDGLRIVTACDDHRARVWEIASARLLMPDLAHNDVVWSTMFSPDGRFIVTGGLDGETRIWRADDLQPASLNPVLRHPSRVTYATFCPDSRRILTTGIDGSFRVWDLAGTVDAGERAAGLPNASATRFLVRKNDSFELHDVTGTRVAGPFLLSVPDSHVEFSQDGHFVISSSPHVSSGATNTMLQVWSVAAPSSAPRQLVIDGPVSGYALGPDASHLAYFSGNTAHLWNLPLSNSVTGPLQHENAISSIAVGLNGSLGTISGNKVSVWPFPKSRQVPHVLEHPTAVAHAEFDSSGKRIVTCCNNNLLDACFAQVWDVLSGEPLSPRLAHGDGVLSASFSPDGSRVVTASEDFSARVWDARTGRQITPALRHRGQVLSAFFSPDGKWVMTVSSDRTARIWNAATGDPLTPPLREGLAPLSAGVLQLDRWVGVDSNSNSYLRPLAMLDLPAQKAVALSDFLSGRADPSLPVGSAGHRAALESLWQVLKAQVPAHLSVTPEEISAWHHLQARQSEADRHWGAAAFHLQRLAILHPEDGEIRSRFERALARTPGDQPKAPRRSESGG